MTDIVALPEMQFQKTRSDQHSQNHQQLLGNTSHQCLTHRRSEVNNSKHQVLNSLADSFVTKITYITKNVSDFNKKK